MRKMFIAQLSNGRTIAGDTDSIEHRATASNVEVRVKAPLNSELGERIINKAINDYKKNYIMKRY